MIILDKLYNFLPKNNFSTLADRHNKGKLLNTQTNTQQYGIFFLRHLIVRSLH